MYDAVLLTTHYNYTEEGQAIPPLNGGAYQDVSRDVPLGLIHIAQYLNNSGFLVRLVHIPQEMDFWTPMDAGGEQKENPLEEILKKYPSRVCGIQAHWYLYCGGVIYVSKLYKKLFPESRVFLGGYMATACWKEFLEFSTSIEGVILGEGEKTIRRILEKSLSSKDNRLEDINGLAFKAGNNETVYNPPTRDDSIDSDEVPIIFPDSPPFKNISWGKRAYISISRGLCPERCAYCVGNNRIINHHPYQTIAIEKILEQLRVYQEFGIREIFLGENHFVNTSYLKKLAENIAKEKFLLHFELETHPILFENEQLLDRLVEARFLKYTMGCESGSDSLLEKMGRNSNVKQIIGSVKAIVERGAFVLTSWISNLPGETHFQFRETQNCLREVVNAGGFVYWIENLHVFPGTAFYEHPEYWGIELLAKNLRDWIRWSSLSKKYLAFEEASEEPLRFLTHRNRDISPREMIDRFYSNRKLALSLVPRMKFNLTNRLNNMSFDMVDAEMKILTWYETRGWKLWLF